MGQGFPNRHPVRALRTTARTTRRLPAGGYPAVTRADAGLSARYPVIVAASGADFSQIGRAGGIPRPCVVCAGQSRPVLYPCQTALAATTRRDHWIYCSQNATGHHHCTSGECCGRFRRNSPHHIPGDVARAISRRNAPVRRLTISLNTASFRSAKRWTWNLTRIPRTFRQTDCLPDDNRVRFCRSRPASETNIEQPAGTQVNLAPCTTRSVLCRQPRVCGLVVAESALPVPASGGAAVRTATAVSVTLLTGPRSGSPGML